MLYFLDSTARKLWNTDYANALYIGLPDSQLSKLQRVQTMAAKLVLQRDRRSSATDALKSLHWLPIRQRIKFKVICLVYRALNGQAPKYLTALLTIKSRSERRLRTEAGILLDVPFVKRRTFAERSFSIQGPRLWNELPSDLRAVDTYERFKTNLKTHLFAF